MSFIGRPSHSPREISRRRLQAVMGIPTGRAMRTEQKQRTIEQRLRYNLGRWNLQLKGEPESKV